MSLRVAAPFVSLFFPTFVAATGISVTAHCSVAALFWTFNSLNQSPCTVAAYMSATCYAGSYTLNPLPSSYSYGGPTHDYSDKCECSTVGYSLLSACTACQGGFPLDWPDYVINCTSTLPPSQFPNPVPAGTRVPYWAILDVTGENNWDAGESYAVGDNPEFGPGAIFGPSGVYTSASSSPTALPGLSNGSSSSGGAIAGGVVGGIALVSIVAVAILYQRRRSRMPSAGSAGLDAPRRGIDETPRPLSDEGMVEPSSPPILTNLPDLPNDQNKFQWYSGPHSVDSPHTGSGSNMDSTRTSLPQTTRGYHGLPMPSV